MQTMIRKGARNIHGCPYLYLKLLESTAQICVLLLNLLHFVYVQLFIVYKTCYVKPINFVYEHRFVGAPAGRMRIWLQPLGTRLRHVRWFWCSVPCCLFYDILCFLFFTCLFVYTRCSIFLGMYIQCTTMTTMAIQHVPQCFGARRFCTDISRCHFPSFSYVQTVSFGQRLLGVWPLQWWHAEGMESQWILSRQHIL